MRLQQASTHPTTERLHSTRNLGRPTASMQRWKCIHWMPSSCPPQDAPRYQQVSLAHHLHFRHVHHLFCAQPSLVIPLLPVRFHPGLLSLSSSLPAPCPAVPLGFYPDNVTIGSAGPNTVYPAPGIPIGLSFLGTAWSEFELIGFAYAYEQRTQTRLQRRAYAAAIPTTQLADVMSSWSP